MCVRVGWGVCRVCGSEKKSQEKSKIYSTERIYVCMCACVCVLSLLRLFVTPWTTAHQVTLYMEFSRQQCWSRMSFPNTGDLPHPGCKPMSLASVGEFFTTAPPAKPYIYIWKPHKYIHLYICRFVGCGLSTTEKEIYSTKCLQ